MKIIYFELILLKLEKRLSSGHRRLQSLAEIIHSDDVTYHQYLKLKKPKHMFNNTTSWRIFSLPGYFFIQFVSSVPESSRRARRRSNSSVRCTWHRVMGTCDWCFNSYSSNFGVTNITVSRTSVCKLKYIVN